MGTRGEGQVPDCHKPQAYETWFSAHDLWVGGQRGQVWGAFLSQKRHSIPSPTPCHLMPPGESGTPKGSLKADFQDRKMCS